MRRALLVVVSVLVGGCATTKTQFTSAEDLAKLRERPKPTKVLRHGARDVDQWELQGPFPDSVTPYAHDTRSPWSQAVLTQPKAVTPTGALHCAAREFARFIAMTNAQPGLLLRDHVFARCGSTSPQGAVQYLSGDVGEQTDDEVFTHWQPEVDKMVRLAQPGDDVGVAYFRSGVRAAVALTTSHSTGELALSLVPSDGKVVLRGTVPNGHGWVAAAINHGATKSASCQSTGREVLPRFEFECQVDATDVSEWVSVSSRAAGRFLGFEFATALVWPGRDRPLMWVRPALVTGAVEATAEALLTALNGVRTSAKLPLLALSAAQSDENRELAPYFFEALGQGQGAEQDRIGLGVIAGWRVEGEVSGGSFTAAWVERPDGGELLNQLLERPHSRSMLLGPQVSTFAPGLLTEGESLGVLLSTYAPVAKTHYRDSMNDAFSALNEVRAKNGLPAVKWVLLPTGIESRLADKLGHREASGNQVLETLLGATVDATGRSVHGWLMTTSSLEQIAWPPELLKSSTVQVVGFIAPVRERGEPWTQYGVFVVVLEGGDSSI